MSARRCLVSLALIALFGCQTEGPTDPEYFSIPLGTFRAGNCATVAVRDSASRLILCDTVSARCCTLLVGRTGSVPCCYTNNGAARLYEYLVLDTASISLCAADIDSPAAVYWRYEDSDSIAEGFSLVPMDSVPQSDWLSRIKFELQK